MKRFLHNIVLFCSGVNTRFVNENCPEEKHKFYPIGLGVIVTAMFAFISMMFAGYSIFGGNTIGNFVCILLFSVFWGLAIFMIDWGLVKTMSKPDFSSLSLWDKIKYIFPLLFRVLVALLISFSISKPLEVKIYEKRLQAQIEKDRLKYVQREQEKKREEIEKNYQNPLEKEREKNERLNIQLSNYNKDDVYKIISENRKECDEEIKKLRRQLSNLPIYIEETIKDENGNNVIIRKRNPRRVELNRKINSKTKELEQLEQRLQDIKSQYEERYKAQQDIVNDRIQDLSKSSAEQTRRDSLDLEEIIKASYVSFNSIEPGLITQIEAMSNYEKTPEGKSTSTIRLILLFTIMCIDTAPIVIKLLTKRGVYEVMMENEVNKLKFLSMQETIANKYLIKELSIAQREVLNKAIEIWKNQEMEDDNISKNYINSKT